MSYLRFGRLEAVWGRVRGIRMSGGDPYRINPPQDQAAQSGLAATVNSRNLLVTMVKRPVMKSTMRRTEIPAGEFKAKCLKLLDEVQQKHREIIITKRGKPVARLLPLAEELPDIFGRMRGTGEILGDIVSPTGEMWNAEKDTDD